MISVVVPFKDRSNNVCISAPVHRGHGRFPLEKRRFGNFSYLIVDVAVCKHRVKILDTFLSVPVVVILQALLYCSHIHRSFNYLIIILQRAKRERSVWELKHLPSLRTGIPPSHPWTVLGKILHAQQILSCQTSSPSASQLGFLIKQTFGRGVI